MSLIRMLWDMLNGYRELKARQNKYFHTSKTVASQYGKSFPLCSLTLPKGVYLALGRVGTGIHQPSSICLATMTGTGITWLESGDGRGTMNSGGGTCCWRLIEVTGEEATLTLQTYGYYSGTYNQTGSLVAIRLI